MLISERYKDILSSFRPGVGAWRRQKREEREALDKYKRMMRKPDTRLVLSVGRMNEGRNRRRKAWIARKREEKKISTGESQVLNRRDWDTADNYLRLEMEQYRRQRITELSTEKV